MFMVLLDCKTEQLNSQVEFGQPIKQTKGLFYIYKPVMASHRSQLHCHYWGMNLLFEW